MQTIFFQFRWWHSQLKRKRKTYRRYIAKRGERRSRRCEGGGQDDAREETMHRPVTGYLHPTLQEHRDVQVSTRNSNFVAMVINAWNFFCMCLLLTAITWTEGFFRIRSGAVSECENMWTYSTCFFVFSGFLCNNRVDVEVWLKIWRTSGKYANFRSDL